MNRTAARAIIDTNPLFAQVDEVGRARLAEMALEVSKPRGACFFREGEPVPGMFFVEEGQVRIFKSASSGKEYAIHLVDPGMVFAEVAVIGGFPAPATAEALEATRCVMLPTAPFHRALRDSHALCLQLLGSMALYVRQFVHQLEDLALRDAKGRLARYLLKRSSAQSVELTFTALKRHLASHLDLTSETLSRTLRRMEEDGLIEKSAGGVRILDREGLRELIV